MARGNDEAHNPNRRPSRDMQWHRMGIIDRRQGYIDALVEQGIDDPQTDEYYNSMLPTGKAITYGRPYQTPSGKWGFEWENRKHPDDHGEETDPLWSNKKSLEGHKAAMRNMDSYSAMADSYYRSMRDAATKESFGDDYNAYRAHMAGELPEEHDEPAPYKTPEGWVDWYSSRGEPFAISNVEGTRHRLTQEYRSPSAARRAGRYYFKGGDTLYQDHEYQTKLDRSLPYELTGLRHL